MPHILRLAVPAMMAAILVAPTLALVLSGRDLQQPETLDPGNLSQLSEWLLRLVTLGLLALSGLVILDRWLARPAPTADRAQWALLMGFLAFFAGNALLPGLLGAEPQLPRLHYYILLIFLAIYARRADGAGLAVDVVKWTLLVFVVASLVYAPLSPDAALRTYAAELRLPWVPFRFWGLSSSANMMGPTALVLILLAIARPFEPRWLNGLAHLGAGLVLVLAQSQTAWLAAAAILPILLLYRRSLAAGTPWRLAIPAGAWLVLGGLAAGALVLAASLLLEGSPLRVEPTGGLTGHGEALTGRGAIWRVAIATFLEHPLFGYGPGAWTLEFRATHQMAFATSAHNQLLQSLSVGGIFGGLGLALYLAALLRGAARTAAASGGLAPALLALTFVRCLTEAPLDLGTLFVADLMLQALLVVLLLDRQGLAPRAAMSNQAQPVSARGPLRAPRVRG